MKTIVKRRPFGKNGIDVSEVSFGAMNLRMLKDLTLSRNLVNSILDQGVNCIDTARAYNSDAGSVPMIESEVILGEVISARTDIDEPLLIITKCHGYTPEDVSGYFQESMQRLRIRQENGKLYIGQTEIKLCYLLHGINEDRWKSIKSSKVIDFAKKMQAEGKFHYLGFSSHYSDVEIIREAIETGQFEACELPRNIYNAVLSEDGEQDIFKLANEHGMGIINMKA